MNTIDRLKAAMKREEAMSVKNELAALVMEIALERNESRLAEVSHKISRMTTQELSEAAKAVADVSFTVNKATFLLGLAIGRKQ